MKSDSMMRLPLGLSTILVFFFWIVNFFLFFNKMGFTHSDIANYYLGNEALYQPARSYLSMLEVSHGHLAIFAVLLLVVTHLVIFTGFSRKLKYSIIGGTYLFAFLSEVSSWLIRFVSHHFSWLKLFSFYGLQLCIFISLIGLVLYIRNITANGNEQR